MADNEIKLPVCGNGHKQPVHGSRFCIYCGIGMTAGGVPAPVPNPPQIPPQMPPQPQPPLNAGYQAYANVPPPNYNPNYQQQPPYPLPVAQHATCQVCGGHGRGLPDRQVICKECNWLRPLVPGYTVDNSAFAWAADARAMNALRSMKPLNAVAKGVSEKVGRHWIEASFNGVLLGEKQMPHIFGQAVRAARILGMTHMPDVYLSGENPWDCLTFGSDTDSFIVVGSALAGNFQGVDMLYLLAREMGHCKAGHALWKTVIRFFLGEQGPAKGFMAGGIFNAILSPTALIGGALEMPLLAWARQAEITADRAGLLAVGSEEVARRTLLSWSLKSSFIFKQINIEAWLEQQREDEGEMLRLSELTTSSTPYLGPRLKLLNEFATGPEFQQAAARIRQSLARNAPPKAQPSVKPETPTQAIDLKIKCSTCSTPMRIPMSVLAEKPKLSVKCPSAKCGKITVIQKRSKPAGPKVRPAKLRKENQNYGE